MYEGLLYLFLLFSKISISISKASFSSPSIRDLSFIESKKLLVRFLEAQIYKPDTFQE